MNVPESISPEPMRFPEDDELPIELAPDDEDEKPRFRLKPARLRVENPANQDTKIESGAPIPMPPARKTSAEPLRWVLDSLHQPAIAAADWLARDIDPTQPSAAALLSNPKITLNQVRQAKTVYKTMRIVGEKAADRHVGARMYAAAIAAGLVRHGKKITTQSDDALKRGFKALLDDRKMPLPLRDLAGMALCVLDERVRVSNNGEQKGI